MGLQDAINLLYLLLIINIVANYKEKHDEKNFCTVITLHHVRDRRGC